MAQQVRDAVNAAAKMAAIKAVTQTIDSLVFGKSSSPRTISNFTDFLVTDPMNKTIAYGQDFLTQTLRGMGSGDYTSASGGVGGDFLTQMLQDTGNRVLDDWRGKNMPTVDYMDYCNLSGGSGMGGANYLTGQSSDGGIFADGNFLCFSAIMSNSVNTPIGLAMALDQEMLAKYQQEKDVASLMATSTGILPELDAYGNVKKSLNDVQNLMNMPFRIWEEALANADSKAFATLIQAYVVAMIADIAERGFSTVGDAVSNNVATMGNKYQQEYGKVLDRVGPTASYARDSYTAAQQQRSRTAPWDNPDTPEDESRQENRPAVWDNPDTAVDESRQSTTPQR